MRSLVIVAFALIGGCCSDVTRDPTQGGLLGGICGISTGAYDQRISEREARLRQIEEQRRMAEQEEVELKAREAQMRRDMNRMRREVGGLNARIAAIKANNATARQKKVELKSRIAALESELDQLQHSSNLTPEQQANRKAELEREISDLWKIINVL